MTLSAGSKLGPYEIVALLGAGGMGEVYKARDPRLSREVALKVLSSQRMTTPEARARFEREARTISQLNHPNVCVLHDVGREGESEYLVMELVEGETLSDRLGRGAIPFETALRIGAEIAAALGAAHAKGIVHRDLKPGNVMLTRSGVKLLDFGLARDFVFGGTPAGMTEAATVGKALTAEGTIVGTLSYMAPEQLEGKEADPRTDIFALGAVLYEMLTGRRAFTGSSPATVISAILTTDPPMVSAAIPISPPDLDRLVRVCLAKDPSDRWQSAHDVELQLKAIASGSGSRASFAAPQRRSSWLPWLVAAACAALAAVALLRGRAPKNTAPPTIRFAVPPPPDAHFDASTVENNVYALSPDGTELAFVAFGRDGSRRLWIRRLSELEAKPVSGTDGARTVFWSPDGRALGFAAGNQLRRVGVDGGVPVTICGVPGETGISATWGAPGDIVFAAVQGEAIYRVAAAGGAAVKVLEPDRASGVGRVNWPWFLPDGRRFLYLARRLTGAQAVMLYEPGSPPREIFAEASRVEYADPGLLFFARDRALFARPFDERAGRASGEAIPVAARVSYFSSSGYAAFTTSQNGAIALQSAADVHHLSWFDRTGRLLGNIGPSGSYLNVRISPDGRRAYFSRIRPTTGAFGILFADLETSTETAASPGPETEIGPLVLPGGGAILYSAIRGRAPQLVRQDLATGKIDEVLPFGTFQFAHDVSPDGRTLLYSERGENGIFDLWTMPLAGGGKPAPFVQSAAGKTDARFSPDGRYVSYIAEEPSGPAIYVAPFPGPGEKVKVTSRSAQVLRWSRAGELLFVSDDGHLVSVPIRTTPALQMGKPVDLFAMPAKAVWQSFDVAPDGKRLMAIVPEMDANEHPLDVIVNWAPAAGR
jgi:serine/threonine protein kinase/Tol biopolymer transport system component